MDSNYLLLESLWPTDVVSRSMENFYVQFLKHLASYMWGNGYLWLR